MALGVDRLLKESSYECKNTFRVYDVYRTFMKDPLNLIWIDLEMTGLSPDHDRIIEIATVVTDKDLNILAEGPVYAVNQPQALLAGMDEWNTHQHGTSGLIKRVQNSQTTEAEAEAKTIEFLSEFLDATVSNVRQLDLSGSTISITLYARPRSIFSLQKSRRVHIERVSKALEY